MCVCVCVCGYYLPRLFFTVSTALIMNTVLRINITIEVREHKKIARWMLFHELLKNLDFTL